MLPSIFGENLFDDWFGFPGFPELRDVDRKLYGKRADHMMKTDVREHGDPASPRTKSPWIWKTAI